MKAFLRCFFSRFSRCRRLFTLFLFATFILYCRFMVRTYETLDGLHEQLEVVLFTDNVLQSVRFSPTAHAHTDSGHVVNSFRIWPRNDTDPEDRLLNQLEYARINARPDGTQAGGDLNTSRGLDEFQDLRKAGFKVIFSEIYNSDTYKGRRPFLHDGCPISTCYLIQKAGRQHRSHFRYDAVLTSGYLTPNIRLSPGGVVIWFQLESPQHSTCPKRDVNWTATYRRASTLRTPYEFFVTDPEKLRRRNDIRKNYAEGKSKMAAIFMSNCRAKNNRTKYILELQRHVDVDIYGNCGALRCSKRNADVCFQILNKDYKFYLAFENSNCRDYITEKFFINGLSNDVVPVVMGAHPDDYRAVAPPHSYIHVDDFESPRHLADYLKLLDQNDTLYNEYFAWKGTGSFINTKFWCRLCAMLHARDKTNYVHTYSNLADWWIKDQCLTDGGRFGASWRRTQNVTSNPDKYKMTSR